MLVRRHPPDKPSQHEHRRDQCHEDSVEEVLSHSIAPSRQWTFDQNSEQLRKMILQGHAAVLVTEQVC